MTERLLLWALAETDRRTTTTQILKVTNFEVQEQKVTGLFLLEQKEKLDTSCSCHEEKMEYLIIKREPRQK
ncbi:MAG: hypothetical protein GY820_36325 [Gammaproteobacteria bacterium]|nr:hypothetical protein [Gammaproteobacteria bacterium]